MNLQDILKNVEQLGLQGLIKPDPKVESQLKSIIQSLANDLTDDLNKKSRSPKASAESRYTEAPLQKDQSDVLGRYTVYDGKLYIIKNLIKLTDNTVVAVSLSSVIESVQFGAEKTPATITVGYQDALDGLVNFTLS